eukprot:m.366367 g.366367  ORF g.366367 m.366367 type:complete len:298 (-) comp56068_c1_seq1:1380-2273(-)
MHFCLPSHIATTVVLTWSASALVVLRLQIHCSLFSVSLSTSCSPRGCEPNSDQLGRGESVAPIPTFDDLLECKITQTNSKPLFNWYQCLTSPWVFRNKTLVGACKMRTVPVLDAIANCSHSEAVIIKVMRSAWLAQVQHTIPLPARHVKLVHNIRAPWDVLHSQILLGWFGSPTQDPDPEFLRFYDNSDMHTFQMNRICNESLVHTEMLARHPTENARTIRYEDLKDDFEGTFFSLIHFLGIKMTDVVRARLNEVRSQYFVTWPPSMEEPDLDRLRKIAQSLPLCRKVLALYDYPLS